MDNLAALRELLAQIRPRRLTAGDLARLELLLDDVDQALANAQARTAELEALYQASLSLTSSLELTHVLQAILDTTFKFMQDTQDAHIFLYDGENLTLSTVQWADGRQQGVPFATPRPEGLTYTVARQGEMILVPDMHLHPLFFNAPPDWEGAIIGLPLKIGQRVVGVLTVAFARPRAFPRAEVRFLRLLADQAAIMIENARLHDLVIQQAHTDALTGLPNRRSFDERLALEIRRAHRYQHNLTLVMLDLNDFKAVNDTYGHPTGDVVLQRAAANLRQNVRDTDFLARYGGDEFAVILPETDLSTAQVLIERLHTRLSEQPVPMPDGQMHRLQACLGLAAFPGQAQTAASLLEAADQALYQAKRAQKKNSQGG
jgi:diguanylate cyclase (GGDEF)-like protein